MLWKTTEADLKTSLMPNNCKNVNNVKGLEER